MFEFDTCSSRKSIPLLIALLIVAQVDLASAFAWPQRAVVSAAFDRRDKRSLPRSLRGNWSFA